MTQRAMPTCERRRDLVDRWELARRWLLFVVITTAAAAVFATCFAWVVAPEFDGDDDGPAYRELSRALRAEQSKNDALRLEVIELERRESRARLELDELRRGAILVPPKPHLAAADTIPPQNVPVPTQIGPDHMKGN